MSVSSLLIMIRRVLGLGFPAISNLKENPFFFSSFSQDSVSANSFGFKVADTGSELYLGGADDSLFTGSIEYHDLSSNNGFWEIGSAAVLVNGASAVSGFQTIIDSGTTIMYGPPSAVEEVYAMVPGSALFDSTNGYFSFPCNSVPNIAFNWGGQDWAISSAKWVIQRVSDLDLIINFSFNLGQTTNDSSQCIGALSALDLGLGRNVWLLGDR